MKRHYHPCTLAFGLLTATFLGGNLSPAIAQTAEDPLEVLRSVVSADRRAVVGEALQFTATEAEGFWPIYHEYRSAMNQAGDRLKQLVLEYAKLYPDVPDDRARQMLKTLAKLEKDQVATRASYLKKFAKALPAAKTLRFAQVESRLDLAVRLDLATYIPLVPIEGQLGARDTGGVLYQEGTVGGVVVRTRRLEAQVAAIDAANRKVTLVSEAGIKQTVKVGPEAVNFDQIRVGDRLRVVATEELVVELAQPGEATDPAAVALVDLAPKGAKPGGVVAGTSRVTGTVTALDLNARTATLRFEDGTLRTLPVRSDVDLGQRKVGDQVVFQVTEMVAISVEKP